MDYFVAGDSSMFILLMPFVYLVACIFLGTNGQQSKCFKAIIMLIGIGILILYYIAMDYISKVYDPAVYYLSTYLAFAYYCSMFWLSGR